MQLYNNALSIPRSANEKLSALLAFSTLLLIIAVGIYFRVHLSFHINGDYFLGADSYRHVRHIRQIVSDGNLPDRDFMRNFPDGVKTTLNTRGFPWLIAQSFKIISRFFPSLPLEKTMALYPVVAITFSGLLYFLVVGKYFGFMTASLSTLAFFTAPSGIGRTTVGYVDTDSLIILLFLGALFFYFRSLEAKTPSKQITSKLIGSGILGLIGILWEGVSLIAGIIYGCEFFIGIYRGFDRKQAIGSILGICLYLGFLFVPGSLYYDKLFESFALSAIFPALLAGCLYIVALIRPNTLQRLNHSKNIIRTKGLIVIGLFLAYPIYRLSGTIISIGEHLLFPFGTDPIMRFVGELRPMNFSDWWNHYGLLFPVGLAGFLLFIYEFCFREKKTNNFGLHLTLFGLEISCVILARGFTPSLLRQPLWVSLTVLFIPVGWTIFHLSYLLVKNRAEWVLPFVIWFLATFSFASSALRFSLFFLPIFVLMGGFCLVKVLRYLIPDFQENVGLDSLFMINIIAWVLFFCGSDLLTLVSRVLGASFEISTKHRLLINVGISLISFGLFVERLVSNISVKGVKITIGRLCGFLVICLLCFFAYTGIYGLGIGQVGYVNAKRTVTKNEEFVHQIRENTPPDAVVAAYWNHGSVINEIGQRGSIIDEEQNLDRIRSFHRQVIFGKSVEETLNFLKKHQATHLMLTTDDFGTLNRYWLEAYPHQPLSDPFIIELNKPFVIKHPTTMLLGFVPKRRFAPSLHQDSTASEPLQISKIVVEFTKNDGYITILTPPQVVLGEGNSSRIISLREVVMGSKQWYFPEAELPITMWLDVAFAQEANRNPVLTLRNAFLLTPKAYELNAVKVFFNELTEYFEEIITEDNGYAKVWKIHH